MSGYFSIAIRSQIENAPSSDGAVGYRNLCNGVLVCTKEYY
jgi:hypothetical protein